MALIISLFVFLVSRDGVPDAQDTQKIENAKPKIENGGGS